MPALSEAHRPSLCAVLLGANHEVEQAVRGQDPPPESVLLGREVGPHVFEVAARHAAWVWVLDGSAVPDPSALGALLSAQASGLRSVGPAVLASKVVAADGSLAPGHVPLLLRSHIEIAMFAFERQAVPIRATPGGSLLVSAAAITEHDPPQPRVPTSLAMLGWTARVLRTGTGFVIPSSIARVGSASDQGLDVDRDPAPELVGLFALLRAKGWEPRERARLGAETFARITGMVASGQMSPSGVCRAAARGMRTGL